MKSTMRRWRSSLLVFFLPIAITCGGLDNFLIEEQSRAVIQSGSLLEQFAGAAGFGEFATVDITQNQSLQNQGVERHQIDSVKILSLTMTIVDPQGEDFTFLDSIEFFVEADGLPKVSIATGGPFPSGASTVELTIPDQDLADYAASESMNITTEARGRRPDQDTTIDANLMLDVDVNVEGAACGG
jgi:hypothetical protein